MKLPDELAGRNEVVALTRRDEPNPVLVVMTWEHYTAIVETLKVLGNPQLTEALQQSIREVGEQNYVDWFTSPATRMGTVKPVKEQP